jgi:serine/threonine protein phosphatase PrpC
MLTAAGGRPGGGNRPHGITLRRRHAAPASVAAAAAATHGSVHRRGATMRHGHGSHAGPAAVGLGVGHAGAQGPRPTMEDATLRLPALRGAPGQASHLAVFGVFDGHGGAAVAKAAAAALPSVLLAALPAAAAPHDDAARLSAALRAAFLGTDAAITAALTPAVTAEQGCTAVVALVTPSHVLVANAGDSRALLLPAGAGAPEQLSHDHKPDLATEARRIAAAGHAVFASPNDVPRVDGVLAVSRGFGDGEFKDGRGRPPEAQAVTAAPEVAVRSRGAGGGTLVLVCDGVTDVLSNDEIGRVVRDAAAAVERRNSGGAPASRRLVAQAGADALVRAALARRTEDNVTAVVVVM